MLIQFANNYQAVGDTNKWRERALEAQEILAALADEQPDNVGFAGELAVANGRLAMFSWRKAICRVHGTAIWRPRCLPGAWWMPTAPTAVCCAGWLPPWSASAMLNLPRANFLLRSRCFRTDLRWLKLLHEQTRPTSPRSETFRSPTTRSATYCWQKAIRLVPYPPIATVSKLSTAWPEPTPTMPFGSAISLTPTTRLGVVQSRQGHLDEALKIISRQSCHHRPSGKGRSKQCRLAARPGRFLRSDRRRSRLARQARRSAAIRCR